MPEAGRLLRFIEALLALRHDVLRQSGRRAAQRAPRAASGGTLCSVVWQRKLDNDWMHSAELVVKSFVEKPEDSDERTCGPGPFSLADAETTSAIVIALGRRRILRLPGARADDPRSTIRAALCENLAQFQTPDGIVAPASTWIVTARAPAA